jgi:hypothetical protein
VIPRGCGSAPLQWQAKLLIVVAHYFGLRPRHPPALDLIGTRVGETQLVKDDWLVDTHRGPR